MFDESQLSGHLKDLAGQSFHRQIYTYTNFLGEGEQRVMKTLEKDLAYTGITLFGGIEHAERCIVRFGRPEDLGYEEPFPVTCIKVEPVSQKYSESLTHRDYLGALLGLGVERDLIGDIYQDGLSAYVFCMEHIAGYFVQNLRQVKHTNVSVTVAESIPESIGPHLEERQIVAASERLDAVIAKIHHLSRSQSLSLFAGDKVFVNGRQCQTGSYVCKCGDQVSVRGYGKFLYQGMDRVTGKGRYRIRVQIYR